MNMSGVDDCFDEARSADLEPELQRYRDNAVGVLLFLLVEDYENRFLQAYRAQGFSDVMRSHGAVFRYLEAGGVPISVIARRAGITKQSVGRLVRELEALGYLSVSSDPSDRRVRRVDFTTRGRALVSISGGIVERIRGDYAAAVGEERFTQFSDALEGACSLLNIAPAWGEQGDRFHHFGRLLVELAEDFEQRLLLGLRERGFRRVTRPMLTVIYWLRPSGQSVSDLARQLPVTVQAVSLTVRDMVSRGYLSAHHCSTDSRSRRLAMTCCEGVGLLAALNESLSGVRREYRESLGAGCLTLVESGVAELTSALSGLEER